MRNFRLKLKIAKSFFFLFLLILNKVEGQKLPEPKILYEKYVLPFDQNNDPILPKRIKPDMLSFFKPGYTLTQIKDVNQEFEDETKKQIDGMYQAALEDFGRSVTVNGTNLLLFIDSVDKMIDRKYVFKLLKESRPNEFDNSYLVASIEFGCLIGKYFENQPGYYWYFDYPYSCFQQCSTRLKFHVY